MGEWYIIGLQTGKKVTEAVDDFIASEHHSDAHGDNFDPTNRKTLSDGSTIYRWYMKWNPYQYADEARMVGILQNFNKLNTEELTNSEDEDFAYKLVAVGEEGGMDDLANEQGYELFDCLYSNLDVTFPEDWDEEESKPIYDIVLLEKPGELGLTKNNVLSLYRLLKLNNAFPMEIGDVNGNSSAMGFITYAAAETLQYEYTQDSGLGQFISSILDDVTKETEDGVYEYQGLKIWLNREVN